MTKKARILTRPATRTWALYPVRGPATLNEPLFEGPSPAACRGYAHAHGIEIVETHSEVLG